MKVCLKHPDKKHYARGMCHSCYQCWRKKNTIVGKEHNKRNKKKEVLRRKLRHKKLVNAIKEENCCTDCKKFYPYWCMQFDHVSDNKSFSISGNWSRTLPTLEKEIAKCELVCATCHAHRTFCRLMQIEHYIIEGKQDVG